MSAKIFSAEFQFVLKLRNQFQSYTDHNNFRKHSKKTSSSFCVDQLVAICYDFFLAGAETSSTTLAWAILFMTLNPEVQEKVAREVTTLLGSRLPGQDDRAK